MAQFINGEGGLSVRTKINDAIATVDSIGSGDNLLMTDAERTKLESLTQGPTTLPGLTDVTITTPADNAVLAYDAATAAWIDQTAAEAGLATAAQVGAKLDASAVSTFGGTLIDDADAATARTTLGLGTAATSAAGDFATAAQGALAATAVQPGDPELITSAERGKLTKSLVSDPTGITGASAVAGMLAFDTQAHLDDWIASAAYDPAIFAFTTEAP